MNAPETWEQAVDVCLAELRTVMIERHTKYGPGNIARHGELGVIVRVSDKVERLNNMIERGGRDFADDSVEDAYTDLGNYGVIGLMVRRGWWALPAECLGQKG